MCVPFGFHSSKNCRWKWSGRPLFDTKSGFFLLMFCGILTWDGIISECTGFPNGQELRAKLYSWRYNEIGRGLKAINLSITEREYGVPLRPGCIPGWIPTKVRERMVEKRVNTSTCYILYSVLIHQKYAKDLQDCSVPALSIFNRFNAVKLPSIFSRTDLRFIVN